MFDYNGIMAEYHDKLAAYETNEREFRRLQQKHERLADKYKLKVAEQKYPHWIENVLKPLGDELVTHFPDSTFDVAGPFGLDMETSISINGKDGKLLAFLEFVPAYGHNLPIALHLRDYTIDTKQFPLNSLGAVNGRNHPSIPIPEDVSVEWFLNTIAYLNRDERK